jgi:competence ComEA-like helix-hairpin-helix protein
MYQAFQNDECLGTIFLEHPDAIPRILESFGISERGDRHGAQEKIPCNSAIRLAGDFGVASVGKIRGTHLISAGRRIDVNSADVEDLMAVPGIGPRLAERIIIQREERGKFSGIEELTRIQGIGKKKLAAWAPYIEAGASGFVDGRLQDVQPPGRLLKPSGRIQK